MLLIYGDEADWLNATAADKEAVYGHYRQFMGAVTELGGTVVDGAELEPTAVATSLRGDQITDGPFLESKENLGGYFVIEARDLDHILAIARRRPPSASGVEIRPIVASPSA